MFINICKYPLTILFLHVASNASNIVGLINGIEQLNGNNYPSWKEKLEIMLALLDLDYALNNEAPKESEDGCENYDVLKMGFEIEKAKWDQSNRKCLMIIKSCIIEGIRGVMPDSQMAKDYSNKIEDQFKGSSKVDASALIIRVL